MASTNKTTNYDLSQYIGTDKPTYLTDYNQDMSKIDAGIHAAKSEADTNASAIGTLSSLTTTAKTSCVAAINEIDAEVATNTNNIATNTSNIATNTTHIGTVANLTTSAKTDLVVAANEINAKVGNIANLETDVKTSTVAAINEIVEKFNFSNFADLSENTITTTNVSGSLLKKVLKLAANSDYSIIKLYGSLGYTADGYKSTFSVANVIPSGYRPSSDITINGSGVVVSNGNAPYALNCDITIKTDGSVLISAENGGYNPSVSVQLVPCLIYIKDFGDVPTPPIE